MSSRDFPLSALPDVVVERSAPRSVTLVGIAVGPSGPVPRSVGLGRRDLERQGFTGRVGQVLVVPGRGRTVAAVGVGERPDATALRDAAAALVRHAGRHVSIAVDIVASGSRATADAQSVTEGAVLAAYRYPGLGDAGDRSPITRIAIIGEGRGVDTGVRRGIATSRAAVLARDLANTPPTYLNAPDIADLAVELAGQHGLDVEVFGPHELAEMGCGGVLGVNRGSVVEPRLVKLSWRPRNPRGHVALVGKGVMYDSGGISLKPSDAFHVVMKMDMSGAAAVLSTMTALADLRCRTAVTGWLVCTDNMPSGSAMKLGDVLTMRNGRTVEVHNTDAEGRLILADGLSLAVEETPDAVIDIATLTGAAMAALGTDIAAVLGTDDAVIDKLRQAAADTGEPIWQMPLERGRYKRLLDSNVADMRNIGGPYAGCITAAIFLSEFVGDTPWAHLDIAGPMKVDADESWRSRGATGFGTRLLIDTVTNW